MLTETETIGAQLVGTVILRPYVVTFLIAFLVVAGRDLGGRRTLAWLVWGWLVAFAAEAASIRIGIPFGPYQYTELTAGREAFVAGVPLFSPLSFPFLAYAAWSVVRAVGGGERDLATVLGAGVLMMLLDVVIDPIAVLGDRWFLGPIFFYPEPGWYFGVPLSNFAGWVLVGWAIVGGLVLTRFLGTEDRAAPRPLGAPSGGAALYYAILLFNLAITLWIGEVLLFALGAGLHAALAATLVGVRRRVRAREPGAWAGRLRSSGARAMEGSGER